MSRPPEREHLAFLSRPGAVRRLWMIFAAILVVSVVSEAFVHMHAAFPVAQLFGFNALYGLLAGTAIVLFARGLGTVLTRGDDYYDREGGRPE